MDKIISVDLQTKERLKYIVERLENSVEFISSDEMNEAVDMLNPIIKRMRAFKGKGCNHYWFGISKTESACMDCGIIRSDDEVN